MLFLPVFRVFLRRGGLVTPLGCGGLVRHFECQRLDMDHNKKHVYMENRLKEPPSDPQLLVFYMEQDRKTTRNPNKLGFIYAPPVAHQDYYCLRLGDLL